MKINKLVVAKTFFYLCIFTSIFLCVYACACHKSESKYNIESRLEYVEAENDSLKAVISEMVAEKENNERIYFEKESALVLQNEILKQKYDSVEHICDLNTYKLNRIDYYVDICAKNSKQKTYLYGWIRRVLNK